MVRRLGWLVLMVALAACGGGRKAETHAITGRYSYKVTFHYGPACDSLPGNVARAGAPVTVSDEHGVTIGAGVLTGGVSSGDECAFSYTVPNVKKTGFYSVRVSNLVPGTVSYDQIRKNGWVVNFSSTASL